MTEEEDEGSTPTMTPFTYTSEPVRLLEVNVKIRDVTFVLNRMTPFALKDNRFKLKFVASFSSRLMRIIPSSLEAMEQMQYAREDGLV